MTAARSAAKSWHSCPLRREPRQVIPHHEVINALVDTLSLRHIAPIRYQPGLSQYSARQLGGLNIDNLRKFRLDPTWNLGIRRLELSVSGLLMRDDFKLF